MLARPLLPASEGSATWGNVDATPTGHKIIDAAMTPSMGSMAKNATAMNISREAGMSAFGGANMLESEVQRVEEEGAK